MYFFWWGTTVRLMKSRNIMQNDCILMLFVLQLKIAGIFTWLIFFYLLQPYKDNIYLLPCHLKLLCIWMHQLCFIYELLSSSTSMLTNYNTVTLPFIYTLKNQGVSWRNNDLFCLNGSLSIQTSFFRSLSRTF